MSAVLKSKTEFFRRIEAYRIATGGSTQNGRKLVTRKKRPTPTAEQLRLAEMNGLSVDEVVKIQTEKGKP